MDSAKQTLSIRAIEKRTNELTESYLLTNTGDNEVMSPRMSFALLIKLNLPNGSNERMHEIKITKEYK